MEAVNMLAADMTLPRRFFLIIRYQASGRIIVTATFGRICFSSIEDPMNKI
jgi:hypothetical protein